MSDRPQRPADIPPSSPAPLYDPPCKHERAAEVVYFIILAVLMLSLFWMMGYRAAGGTF